MKAFIFILFILSMETQARFRRGAFGSSFRSSTYRSYIPSRTTYKPTRTPVVTKTTPFAFFPFWLGRSSQKCKSGEILKGGKCEKK